jgi:hypothetical protein
MRRGITFSQSLTEPQNVPKYCCSLAALAIGRPYSLNIKPTQFCGLPWVRMS